MINGNRITEKIDKWRVDVLLFELWKEEEEN